MMERLQSRRDPMAGSQLFLAQFSYVVIVNLLFITLCSFPSSASSQPNPSRGLCTSKYLRNNVTDLLKLEGCRVIEGNLQISLIDDGIPAQYKNYSFPDLREITGYFLLFSASGLQTLRHLFPNLAVIRGQDFIYEYAFLINEMPDMQEIGLLSLTNVMGRGVFFSNNPNLCYVDTVEWGLITNGSQENVIQKNKPSDQCPNNCPSNCSKSTTDQRDLCWTNADCQIVHKKSCACDSGLCYGSENKCCSDQCLGGCTGQSPMDCFVCKHFENDLGGDNGFICMGHCETGTYEYSNRRCVRKDECSNITSYDPRTKQLRRGKILSDQDKCVLDCPKGYISTTKNGIEVCEKCKGTCKKECNTKFVDSSESSKALKGCTRITGNLKIQIRGYSANLMNDLKTNLDMIEEINGNLVVINSHFITSLEFLKSLKYIHGGKFDERNQTGFAVEVKSNDNMRELFGNQTVIISNKKARVLFHYNPQLCAHKIWEFVDRSTISRPVDNKIDIGTTNGDKVPCNQKTLDLYEVSKVQNSVTIKWENFRKQLIVTAHLLNYEIYYKISSEQNASIYQDRDVCGNDDWTVEDATKLNFDGPMDQEPEFEEEKIITSLRYYTQYAFYVKTVVIPLPDSNSTKHNIGGISSICYITTLPSVPSQPREFTLSPSSTTSIKLEWIPPLNPNGIIEKYEIYLKEEEHDVKFQNQRDYCQGRPDLKVVKKEEPQATLASFPDAECCSCTTKTKKDTSTRELLENDITDSIINAVFVLPNQEKSSNQVKSDGRRRRRRRAINSDSGFGNETENSAEAPVFPGGNPLQDSISPSSTAVAGMIHFMTVNVSEAKATGDFEVVLEGLAHYSRYTIAIRACRDAVIQNQTNGCKEMNSTTVVYNDTKLCSEVVRRTINTLHSPSADLIDVNTIRINVTLNKVVFTWEEPKEPNGIVMSYKINVTRADAASTNEAPHLVCLTRVEFNESGRNYKFRRSLNPGNYSVAIQVISLAPYESNYTMAKYFVVLKIEEGISTGQVLAILLPIVIVLLMGVGVAIYVVKTRREIDKIISANPEYLQNINIPDEWEVPSSNIKFVIKNDEKKELGKGSFGMVYEGILTDFRGYSCFPCAIKSVAENSTSEDRYKFLTEASMMTQMDCHHVVKLLGVVSTSRPTYVIMELMALGDLKNYLISRRPEKGGEPPTLRQILRMSAGIGDGMAYLDDHKFVHRDLAARNCMVTHDLTVKVGDFGMTKDVMETEYYRKETRGLLPVRWMAPESIRGGIFTIQSDVWSFGVVLWEMATLAAQPYQGLNNDQVLRYVRDGGIMERPENCPDVLYNMMIRCWQPTPQARPTFAEILDWLLPELEKSFTQVSFYHSPAGIKYRASLQSRPVQTQEEMASSKTPLRATCDDELFTESDEEDDDIRSDGELHSIRRNGPSDAISASLDSTTNLPTAFPHRNRNNQSTNNNNHTDPSDFVFLDMNRIRNPTNLSPSSRNLNQRTPSESTNVNVNVPKPETNRTPYFPETGPPSNDSSKALSIVFSPSSASDGNNRIMNNGIGPPTGFGLPFSNPMSGVNGYISLKHSPPADNAKSRTTQF